MSFNKKSYDFKQKPGSFRDHYQNSIAEPRVYDLDSYYKQKDLDELNSKFFNTHASPDFDLEKYLEEMPKQLKLGRKRENHF